MLTHEKKILPLIASLAYLKLKNRLLSEESFLLKMALRGTVIRKKLRKTEAGEEEQLSQ